MQIDAQRVWQQAAGDTNRNYVAVCLEWDVILNGPGHAGSWPGCRDALEAGGVTSRKLTDLRRFCEEMQDGDHVVLRTGTSTVHAVGKVVGDYSWNDAFGDVDGWDLQHVRRVRWLWSAQEANADNIPDFPTYTMKLGDTTQRLDAPDVLDWMRQLEPNIEQDEQLVGLPGFESKVALEEFLTEVSEYLFDQGVASDSIENVKLGVGELQRIAGWYQRGEGNNPSESETIAYLIVPLLRALGWTPQKMAIEWNRVDLALFEALPRTDNNLSVVVEAKKKGASCLTAASQARAYAADRGGCDRLIVTDGIRYGVFAQQSADDPAGDELIAYLNLTRLREDYPIYGCGGAKQALLAMTPEWSPTA